MPWPLAHRDINFHCTGVADYKNKAFVCLTKSKYSGDKYHGYTVPEHDDSEGLVEMEIINGFHFF